MLNLCGIVVAILKMATGRKSSNVFKSESPQQPVGLALIGPNSYAIMKSRLVQ
jgi:hypothetical protein